LLKHARNNLYIAKYNASPIISLINRLDKDVLSQSPGSTLYRLKEQPNPMEIRCINILE